jgi:hypothetical protein
MPFLTMSLVECVQLAVWSIQTTIVAERCLGENAVVGCGGDIVVANITGAVVFRAHGAVEKPAAETLRYWHPGPECVVEVAASGDLARVAAYTVRAKDPASGDGSLTSHRDAAPAGGAGMMYQRTPRAR